jgi:hypothetical protein
MAVASMMSASSLAPTAFGGCRKGLQPARRRTGVVRGVVVTHAALFRIRSNGHSNSSSAENSAAGVTRVTDTNGDTIVTKFTLPKRDLGLGDIGRAATPGGGQIVYMDPILAVIGWMRFERWVATPTPGGVRLV